MLKCEIPDESQFCFLRWKNSLGLPETNQFRSWTAIIGNWKKQIPQWWQGLKSWSHEWIESSPCWGKSRWWSLLWLARLRGRGWKLGQFGRKTYKWMSQAQDMKTFVISTYKNIQLYKNIARIAKATSHKLPGKLSSNVSNVRFI